MSPRKQGLSIWASEVSAAISRSFSVCTTLQIPSPLCCHISVSNANIFHLSSRRNLSVILCFPFSASVYHPLHSGVLLTPVWCSSCFWSCHPNLAQASEALGYCTSSELSSLPSFPFHCSVCCPGCQRNFPEALLSTPDFVKSPQLLRVASCLISARF